jgi:hypothetical protein
MNITTFTTYDKLNLVNELLDAGEFEELHEELPPLEKELLTTALIQLSEIDYAKL